jgi:ribulose 1,5-bisphosphate synthetase/thiazole synthase
MRYEYFLSTITVIIGASVASAAYLQYRLAKNKFRLDLFEKRFAVYKGAQAFLNKIMNKGRVELNDLFEFRAATQDAIFLFENDISEFMNSLDEKACTVGMIEEQFKDLEVGEERSRLAKEKSEGLNWLLGQLPRLKDVFGPYLKFRAWN